MPQNFTPRRHRRKIVIQIDLSDASVDRIPRRAETRIRKNLKFTWITTILSNRRKVEEMKTSNKDRKIRKKKAIIIKNLFHNTLGTILYIPTIECSIDYTVHSLDHRLYSA